MGSKKTRAAVSAVTYILISILAVICVFPFFWMLISALKPKDEIRSAVPSLLIDNPTIDNFRRVLVDNGFLTYIKNSFVVSLAATLISMIIAVLAGYALSRYYRKRIVKTSNFMMMLSQMIPGVLLLVPLYMIMQQMHMLETHISLVLAYTTFVIPLCTFMMSSFFQHFYSCSSIYSYTACKETSTSSECEFCRAERIFHSAIRRRLADESTS